MTVCDDDLRESELAQQKEERTWAPPTKKALDAPSRAATRPRARFSSLGRRVNARTRFFLFAFVCFFLGEQTAAHMTDRVILRNTSKKASACPATTRPRSRRWPTICARAHRRTRHARAARALRRRPPRRRGERLLLEGAVSRGVCVCRRVWPVGRVWQNKKDPSSLHTHAPFPNPSRAAATTSNNVATMPSRPSAHGAAVADAADPVELRLLYCDVLLRFERLCWGLRACWEALVAAEAAG